MKYKDPITGELKSITVKSGDTLPIGTIVEFDGTEIPDGYEEVTYEETGSMGSIIVDDITCKNMFDKELLANPQISPIKYIAIKVKPNTQYTFSSNIPKKFDGVGAYIIAGSGKTNSNTTDNGGVWNGQTRTFTSDNEGYISLGYRIDENISSLNDYWYQIEPGQVATDYVEHREFSNKQIYSTTEQVIGTWIDGKPLYRKVYITNSISETNQDLFDVNSLKIDTLITLRGIIHTIGTQKFPVPMYDSNTNYSVLFIGDNSIIRGRAVIGSGVFKNLVITLEYTKTTD